jgi:tRNA-2-methylthio-N6-dimethylallyladenosine synthase
MERVGYDSAFVFKYSPRPGTEAAGWPDDVPQPVKERRNRILLDLQARISREKLRTWIGRDVEVLVEERNRRGQLSGKSRSNTTVVAEGPDSLIGELVRVRVTRVTETTMIGELGEPATLAR